MHDEVGKSGIQVKSTHETPPTRMTKWQIRITKLRTFGEKWAPFSSFVSNISTFAGVVIAAIIFAQSCGNQTELTEKIRTVEGRMTNQQKTLGELNSQLNKSTSELVSTTKLFGERQIEGHEQLEKVGRQLEIVYKDVTELSEKLKSHTTLHRR